MGEGFNLEDLVGIPIKRIEILLPPSSYIFGLSGNNGAILITSDWKMASQMQNQHMAKITPLGYKKAVEFYAPKYETDSQRNSSRPDLRTTIYWKPDVQVTDGISNIEFYTADATNTTYSVVFEGITTDGVVVRQTGEIARQNK